MSTLEKTGEALQSSGITVRIVDTKEEALQKLIDQILEGSAVMNGSTTTL